MNRPEWVPIRFIDEEIEVLFDQPPLLTKKPGAPAGFSWRGQTYRVTGTLASWTDYGRRGRAALNMKPAHQKVAERRGSWGVGRFYFRVSVEDGRVFDLCYDRAPQAAADRAGHWFIWRELKPTTERGAQG